MSIAVSCICRYCKISQRKNAHLMYSVVVFNEIKQTIDQWWRYLSIWKKIPWK